MRWLSLFTVLLSSAPALAGGPLAILPLEGEPALAARLEPMLSAALARRKVSALAPAAVSRQLRELPASARAREQAERALAQADREGLRMRRPAAVRAARQAVETLEASGARFHSRRELARACEALARAELLRPADEKQASAAIERALAVEPGHLADPDRSPPRLRALLEAARERPRTPAAPTAEVLARIASAAGAGRVLWLAATGSAGTVALELVLASPGGAVERHGLPAASEAASIERAAERIAAALGISPPAPAASASRPAPERSPTPAAVKARADGAKGPLTAPSPAPAPAASASRAWYRRWWVWALAGAVVAGTAVGLGVGLSQRRATPGWEIAFTF